MPAKKRRGLHISIWLYIYIYIYICEVDVPKFYRQRILLTIVLAAETYGLFQSPSGSNADRLLVATLTWTQLEHTVAKSTNSSFSRPLSSSHTASLGRTAHHENVQLIIYIWFYFHSHHIYLQMMCKCFTYIYIYTYPCMVIRCIYAYISFSVPPCFVLGGLLFEGYLNTGITSMRHVHVRSKSKGPCVWYQTNILFVNANWCQ